MGKRLESVRAGIKYQDLIAAEALIEMINGSANPPLIVRLEDRKGGSFDDVVTVYADQTVWKQVKWAQNPGSEPLTVASLSEAKRGKKSSIRKFADSFKQIDGQNRAYKLELITNRSPDTEFQKLLHGTASRLKTRLTAKQKELVSNAWRAGSGLAEVEFAGLLNKLSFLVNSPDIRSRENGLRTQLRLLGCENAAFDSLMLAIGDWAQDAAKLSIEPRDVEALLGLQFDSPSNEFQLPRIHVARPEVESEILRRVQLLGQGYFVVLGSPGAGKSTLLNTLSNSAGNDFSNDIITYNCFTGTSDGFLHTRAGADNFAKFLARQLHTLYGLRGLTFSVSASRIEPLLSKASQALQNERKLILVIDGIDYARRYAPKDAIALFASLPPALPTNVIVVVSAQVTDQLPPHLQCLDGARYFAIPPMTPSAIMSLLSLYGVFDVQDFSSIDQEDLAYQVWKQSAGHALHVGYIARQLSAAGENRDLFQLVAETPACHGDVEQYYRTIFESPETAVARSALSIMADCPFELSAAEIASVMTPPIDWYAVDDSLRPLRYLFRVIDGKYHFAHDSLRVFAASKLEKDRFPVAKQIAFLYQLKNDARIGEHLLDLRSSVASEQTAIDEIDCDWLAEQISDGANIHLLDEGLTRMALAELKQRRWGEMARWWALQSCLQRASGDLGLAESTLVGSWLSMKRFSLVDRYIFVSSQFLSTVYPGPDLVDLLEQNNQFDLVERLLSQQMSQPLPPIDALSTGNDYEFVRYIRHAARKLSVAELLPVIRSRAKDISEYHRKNNFTLLQPDAARIAQYVESVIRHCLHVGDLTRAEKWLLEDSVELPDSDRAELFLHLSLMRGDLATQRKHISSAIGYVESLSLLDQIAVAGGFDIEVCEAIQSFYLNPMLQNQIEWYDHYSVSSKFVDLFKDVSVCSRLRVQSRIDATYRACESVKCRVGRIFAQETARIAETMIVSPQEWKSTLQTLIAAIRRVGTERFSFHDIDAAQGFMGAIGIILRPAVRYAKENSCEAEFADLVESRLLPTLIKSKINYPSGRLSLFEMLQSEAICDDFAHRLLVSVEDQIAKSISHNAESFIDLSSQYAQAGDMVAAKRLLVRGIRAAFSYGYRKDTTINDFLVAFNCIAEHMRPRVAVVAKFAAQAILILDDLTDAKMLGFASSYLIAVVFKHDRRLAAQLATVLWTKCRSLKPTCILWAAKELGCNMVKLRSTFAAQAPDVELELDEENETDDPESSWPRSEFVTSDDVYSDSKSKMSNELERDIRRSSYGNGIHRFPGLIKALISQGETNAALAVFAEFERSLRELLAPYPLSDVN